MDFGDCYLRGGEKEAEVPIESEIRVPVYRLSRLLWHCSGIRVEGCDGVPVNIAGE